MNAPARIVRDDAEGFADLAGWAALVDDGLVLTRDGTLLAGYYLSPPDPDGAPIEERAALCHRLAEASKRFGTGWALWADTAVVPSAQYPDGGFFPDEASAAIDAERAAQFRADGEHFEAERVAVFCFRPPAAVVRRLTDRFYRHGGRHASASGAALQPGQATRHAALASMENVLHGWEDAAGDLVRPRRMRSYLLPDVAGREHLCDELVNYLHYCATGRAHPIRLPDHGAFLDVPLGGQDLVPGEPPLLGDELVACVSIDGFPAESQPGILDALGRLGLPYRFSQRAVFMDRHDAEAEINLYRKGWTQQIIPAVHSLLGIKRENAPVNHAAIEHQKETDIALAWAKSERVSFLYYKATVVLRHPDAKTLLAMAREARVAIGRAGFGARIEGVNATESFFGTLPGNFDADLRRPPVHTENFADLMPTAGVWTGLAFNPNPLMKPAGQPALMRGRTAGGEPFRFNVHVSDLGHFGYFGPPGTGKSSLMNLTGAQSLRYRSQRVRGIDIKDSMLVTTAACGGNHVKVGGEGTPAFAPFAVLETGADALRAQAWAEACVRLQTRQKIESHHTTAISQALTLLRDRPKHRSITNFIMAVQHSEVRDAMRYYELGSGPGGPLFDGQADQHPASHYDVFDLTHVLGAGDAILMPAVMALLARFEREMDGDPMLLLMDEVGVQIAVAFWIDQLVRLFKVTRSFNVAVGIATQNLPDVWKHNLLTVLQENMPTRLYGANPAAERRGSKEAPGPADFYEAFGLDETRREALRWMASKRQYAIDQPDGWRVVDFNLGPVAVALCASTAQEDADGARAILVEHGKDRFAGRWLGRKGVDHALAV